MTSPCECSREAGEEEQEQEEEDDDDGVMRAVPSNEIRTRRLVSTLSHGGQCRLPAAAAGAATATPVLVVVRAG